MKPSTIRECALAILQLVKLPKATRATLEQNLPFALNVIAGQFEFLVESQTKPNRNDLFNRWVRGSPWSRSIVESEIQTLRELFTGIHPHAQDDDGFVRVLHHYRTPHRGSISATLKFLATELTITGLDVT